MEEEEKGRRWRWEKQNYIQDHTFEKEEDEEEGEEAEEEKEEEKVT